MQLVTKIFKVTVCILYDSRKLVFWNTYKLMPLIIAKALKVSSMSKVIHKTDLRLGE